MFIVFAKAMSNISISKNKHKKSERSFLVTAGIKNSALVDADTTVRYNLMARLIDSGRRGLALVWARGVDMR